MIRMSDVSVRAGAFRLSGVDLLVPSGQYAVLMGKTGSGKSTLLEAICGLKPIAQGRIELNGVDVSGMGPALRCVGYVPQDGALFSTMSVRDNLAFALEIRHMPNRAVEARVGEIAELLGLSDLLHRAIPGLSGGERQRVALGRALAFQPPVLLLDEPLSAVDEDTRENLCRLLKSVQQTTNTTVLHVTHNRAEAERLAAVRFHIADGRVDALPSPTVCGSTTNTVR
ncbi:MAG: ABC transporter ATP-binding protein [Lentisphaerae bacterium RIFOXYB12_FULL_65_16]|nr:MAG: ABC transporter ATP-binding protein [Lentisphaerae bacterium RIFOXYA12_64_32]OGV86859.1 MAG: ABC transporter ATP-binding protein [Lentisphaerae bacterium RIFOXYB12_FULL_65_16]